MIFLRKTHIIKLTEPDTPLNDAYHVGSFFWGAIKMQTKEQQPPLSVQEQIRNLQNNGLIVQVKTMGFPADWAARLLTIF